MVSTISKRDYTTFNLLFVLGFIMCLDINEFEEPTVKLEFPNCQNAPGSHICGSAASTGSNGKQIIIIGKLQLQPILMFTFIQSHTNSYFVRNEILKKRTARNESLSLSQNTQTHSMLVEFDEVHATLSKLGKVRAQLCIHTPSPLYGDVWCTRGRISPP